MFNPITLEGLLKLQEEQGIPDATFYEMITDKVCEDPAIDKGLLEYDDIYEVVKGMIEKTKGYSLKPGNFIKDIDHEFWEERKSKE